MALKIPNLDNKRFEQFVEENQASLPALASAWTDYNLSDPGITLLELFAWLSDIQLYRLNRVDSKHLLKYLKLLGAKPKNAVPSTTWLTFDTIEKKIEIGRETTVMAHPPHSDLALPFVLEKSIKLYSAVLSEISLQNERGDIVYEDARFPIFFYPFGEATREKSQFRLVFDDVIDDDFLLTFILYEEGLSTIEYDETFEVFSSVALSWNYYDERSQKWEKLKIIEDNTYNLSISGSIHFEKTTPYREIECILENGSFENAPRVQKLLTNTVKATQIERNHQIFSKVGTGLPNQVLMLGSQPILKIDKLIVNGDLWREEDSLELYNHQQQIYTVDNTTGVIYFGDNVHGTPLPHQATVEVSYESSYGTDGNIVANTKWSSETLSKEIQITNHFSAQGGKDPQSIEEAFISFQKELQTPSQAVTAEDFEYIAQHTPNLRVARAKAHSKKRENLVEVTVIPSSLQERPYPSENFRKTICKHLEKQRLITTKIRVIPPNYVLISIMVEIKLKNSFQEEESKRSIEKSLSTFLHPLKGWKDGKGWPFGQSVYRSDIYSLLEAHPSVECIVYLYIHAEGRDDSSGNIPLQNHELTRSNRHKISFLNPKKICRSSL